MGVCNFLHTTPKTLITAAHFPTSLHIQNQAPVSVFTFESSACKKSQAAGTSPNWRVRARWALKEEGSGELAAPGGTRQVWLGPSWLEKSVPCGARRRSVSSCDGPSARVPSGSSPSWDSWPSLHSSASHRSAPQGRWVLQRSFPSYELILSICMDLNWCKQPFWLLPQQRERWVSLLKYESAPFFTAWVQTLLEVRLWLSFPPGNVMLNFQNFPEL